MSRNSDLPAVVALLQFAHIHWLCGWPSCLRLRDPLEDQTEALERVNVPTHDRPSNGKVDFVPRGEHMGLPEE